MGVAAARRIRDDRAFQKVIAVDRDIRWATLAAEECGSKATPAQLDTSDDGSFDQMLSDVDLVVNTIRMPLPQALPLMRGVMEAGASYVDASSDPEALQAIFDSEYLNALAGYRAVSAVPGMGASPGLTNALTSYLSQRLDRVDEASFYLVDDLRRRSDRQWRARLTEFGATALVWRDSEWQHVMPLSENTEVSFPAPLGRVYCTTVGMGPVTLPSNIASLADLSNHRGFSDPAILNIVRNLVAYGFGSDDPVVTTAGDLSPIEFASELFSRSRDVWTGDHAAAAALFGNGDFADPVVRQTQVAGILGGRKTRFTMTYYFPGEEEADNIAAPLVVGAKMLLTREIPAPGVHPPESLDPAPFLWDMERRGVEIQLSKAFED